MSTAPKGQWITETNKSGKEIRQFKHDIIVVLGECGTVTKSYWIPSEDRWCMFVESVPPVAWRYPKPEVRAQ